MRYRKEEKIFYNAKPDDLFSETKEAVFLRYVGNLSAKIYIKNDGFYTVPRTTIMHKSEAQPCSC